MKINFDVLNNDSTNYSHWHEVRASWQLIDRIENYGPKMELLSMNTSQDPWDQLHPMISLAEYGAEWVWKPEPKN